MPGAHSPVVPAAPQEMAAPSNPDLPSKSVESNSPQSFQGRYATSQPSVRLEMQATPSSHSEPCQPASTEPRLGKARQPVLPSTVHPASSRRLEAILQQTPASVQDTRVAGGRQSVRKPLAPANRSYHRATAAPTPLAEPVRRRAACTGKEHFLAPTQCFTARLVDGSEELAAPGNQATKVHRGAANGAKLRKRAAPTGAALAEGQSCRAKSESDVDHMATAVAVTVPTAPGNDVVAAPDPAVPGGHDHLRSMTHVGLAAEAQPARWPAASSESPPLRGSNFDTAATIEMAHRSRSESGAGASVLGLTQNDLLGRIPPDPTLQADALIFDRGPHHPAASSRSGTPTESAAQLPLTSPACQPCARELSPVRRAFTVTAAASQSIGAAPAPSGRAALRHSIACAQKVLASGGLHSGTTAALGVCADSTASTAPVQGSVALQGDHRYPEEPSEVKARCSLGDVTEAVPPAQSQGGAQGAQVGRARFRQVLAQADALAQLSL